ncbi:DUF3560 domain-containing protein [uncultured Shewanella sp.]|uniref:DUF3560 domain-containing protein n=1 Tax=uncultured Shewanella sp. TaxID=173975 RepID=UPI002616E45E|nr:DUF3560 domain-containing protein [uncultured Shewanella sp.]
MKTFNFPFSAYTFDATYSVEDNKIRLYPQQELDREHYDFLKDLGFKWAPKQGQDKTFNGLMFALWTTTREDFALLASNSTFLDMEEMSLIERAAERAARFERYANNRLQDAHDYHQQANQASEAVPAGQPILAGHHSEAKARKLQNTIKRCFRKSDDNIATFNYWIDRIKGVQYFANRKASYSTRSNRIKGLLKELRDVQKKLNNAHYSLTLLNKWLVDFDDETLTRKVKFLCGAPLKATNLAAIPYKGYKAYEGMTAVEIINESIKGHQRTLHSQNIHRWIAHLLGRIGYERGELGECERFEGKMTAAVLQAFARENGALQPKAKQNKDTGEWVLTSLVPLPCHLSDSSELSLSDDEWRDVMQVQGYSVPPKRAPQLPLLNLDVKTISRAKGYQRDKLETLTVIHLTKAEYKAIYEGCRGVTVSACGQFRSKLCHNPKLIKQNSYHYEWVAVFFTDAKAHPVPESNAINYIAESEKVA